MAYIDFSLRPPPETTERPAADTPGFAVHPARAKRLEEPCTALWLAVGIALVFVALIYVLALTSIGEPLTAAIVTVVLLLPAASLFGGSGRRHH
jgi:hypothetical protein